MSKKDIGSGVGEGKDQRKVEGFVDGILAVRWGNIRG